MYEVGLPIKTGILIKYPKSFQTLIVYTGFIEKTYHLPLKTHGVNNNY
jgi:hypothetical protein